MKKHKVSQEQHNIWVKRYLAGETARNIAKDYPIFHESTIMRHIKKEGISRNGASYYIQQNKEKIRDDFIKNGLYCEDIAKKYRIDVNSVYRILDSYNIKRQTGYKTKCNTDYFEKIDNPDKAYLLGFITADGSIIGKYHNSCTIEVQEKDRELIEYAKNQINPKAKITICNYKEKRDVKVSFGSKKLCSDLSKFQVVPNKSKIIKRVPTEYIPQKFLKYYFRGLIDGDGCIHKDGGLSIYSASKSFIESVQEIFCEETKVKKLKIYYNKCCYFISWHSREDKQKIYDYLYKDCLSDCFYYKRKYFRLYNSLYGNPEVIN